MGTGVTLEFDSYERDLWSGRASVYAASFASLCAGAAESLLDAAGVTSGTRMLDVGTGPGTVARLAVARGAIVSAVDAEPTMVELAGRDLPDVRLAVLPELPFEDDVFDAAVANCVVNHVGDPAAALREMRRVVRPGGTVAVTIWPGELSVVRSLVADAIEAAGVVTADMPRLDEDLDFRRDADGFGALLMKAGLSDVVSTEIAWEHRVDPEVWWSGPAGGLGGVGYVLTRQTPEMVAKIKQEYDRLAAPRLDTDGSLPLPAIALLAHGRA